MALTYGKVDSVVDLLDRVAALNQYKPFNALLLLLQRPAARHVLPAHQWHERWGHVIRPNEQPLVMLQRGGPVMYLFDVSQTEPGHNAMPLPRWLTDPYAMPEVADADVALGWAIENAKYDGVRVLDAGFGHGLAGCIQRTDSRVDQVVRRGNPSTDVHVDVQFDVQLSRGQAGTARLATLAHELGHLYCGHLGPCSSQLWPNEKFWPDRAHIDLSQSELEAESVARVVFARLFPGLPLPDHLRQYFADPPSLDGLELELVLTAAGRVLVMAEGRRPRRPRSPDPRGLPRPRATPPIAIEQLRIEL